MLPETNDFSIFTTISPFPYIDCLYIVYLYIISNIYLCQGILSPYLTSFFHFNRKKYAQNSSFQNRSVHSFLFSFYFSFSVLLFTRIFQLYSAIMQSSPAFSKTSFRHGFEAGLLPHRQYNRSFHQSDKADGHRTDLHKLRPRSPYS